MSSAEGSGSQIISWLEYDADRIRAIELAASLKLNDWCIAAGFVRNLVWDKLHGYAEATPLNDIDLIYFDLADTSLEAEKSIELKLKSRSFLPWSVKNQARMHLQNGDAPYQSVEDAMRYWVEIETAVGVKLSEKGALELIAPFGVGSLLNGFVTMNHEREKSKAFEARVQRKKWLEIWPKLKVV